MILDSQGFVIPQNSPVDGDKNNERRKTRSSQTTSQETNNMEHPDTHNQGTPTAAGGDQSYMQQTKQRATGVLHFVDQNAARPALLGFFYGCGACLAFWAGSKTGIIKVG